MYDMGVQKQKIWEVVYNEGGVRCPLTEVPFPLFLDWVTKGGCGGRSLFHSGSTLKLFSFYFLTIHDGVLMSVRTPVQTLDEPDNGRECSKEPSFCVCKDALLNSFKTIAMFPTNLWWCNLTTFSCDLVWVFCGQDSSQKVLLRVLSREAPFFYSLWSTWWDRSDDPCSDARVDGLLSAQRGDPP